MLQQANLTAPVTVRVVDVPQKEIINNRRKLRQEMLKQLGQRSAISKKNIEKLAQLTS